MLKTIKRIEYFRLDELIHYIKQNNIINKSFHTVGGDELGELIVHDSEPFEVYGHISCDSVFPVEVEKRITKDMIFRDIIEVYDPSNKFDKKHYFDVTREDYYTVKHTNKSINDVVSEGTKRIYVLMREKLELVWEE